MALKNLPPEKKKNLGNFPFNGPEWGVFFFFFPKNWKKFPEIFQSKLLEFGFPQKNPPPLQKSPPNRTKQTQTLFFFKTFPKARGLVFVFFFLHSGLEKAFFGGGNSWLKTSYYRKTLQYFLPSQKDGKKKNKKRRIKKILEVLYFPSVGFCFVFKGIFKTGPGGFCLINPKFCRLVGKKKP